MEEEVKPPLSVAMHSHESTTGAETASLRGSLQTLQTQTAEHITRLDAIPNTITMDLTVRLRVSASPRLRSSTTCTSCNAPTGVLWVGVAAPQPHAFQSSSSTLPLPILSRLKLHLKNSVVPARGRCQL
jgi:hypothetical protein